jgi:hypothetical protein
MEQASDVKEFGRGAKGHLRFKYLVLPDGTRLPLRGIVDLTGKSVNKGVLIVALAAVGLRGASGVTAVTGLGFAIPAGTLIRVEVEGEQKVHVNAQVHEAS